MEAKKALFNISKLLPQCPFPFTSRACLSTSYQHPQGSNAGVEGMYQVKTREGQPQSPPQQDSRTAEDSAKEGIKKGVEMAENVGDSAKKTLDGAWKAAKDTAKVVKESLSENNKDDEAVDEVKSIEELRVRARGYDNAP
ncbi:hypothetical protein E1A91_A04G040300v1 [Gossypium mustelinum]|uniref:Uncharacterized protein n=1 Tax=Gossypium mustelinum TaxID=34275 RepID=A0A5D2ZJ67_GOSMU|nr:hypothetical protein E1A91_A04G040300v1 [Gossypium mustelinum]